MKNQIGSTSINICFEYFFQVFVNEVDNDPASQAVEIVMNYIKKNPALGLSVQIMPIEGNRTDSKKFLENSKSLVNYTTLLYLLYLTYNPGQNERFKGI